MKKIILYFLNFIFVLISLNCATIFKGGSVDNGKEEITIASTPYDAEVYINGKYIGNTPTKIKLASKENHFIEIRKTGYKSKFVKTTNFAGAGWIILDILGFPFALTSLIVDAVTGDWFYLNEKKFDETMEVE